MASDTKRARRFALLAKVEKLKVEQAAARYRSGLTALEQARDKLKGLEEYFSGETPPAVENRTAIAFAEASLFAQRLHSAISAQRVTCTQLETQCEHLRQGLLQAERRRSGMDRTRAAADLRSLQETHKSENRQTEDALMARYSRHE